MLRKNILVVIFLSLIVITTGEAITFVRQYGMGDSAEAATDIVATPDGGFLIVGTVFDSSAILWLSNMDGLALKIDSTGEPVWIKRFGNTSWIDALTSVIAVDDKFVMTGIKNDDQYGGQVWFLKIDANGNVLSEKCYGGAQFKLDIGSEIVPATNSGYFIIGTTKSFTPDQKGDVWLLRLNENGDTLWTKTYNLGNDDGGTSIIHFSANRYIITANTCTGYQGMVPVGFATYLIIDSIGNVLDSAVFHLGELTTFTKIAATQDGGAVITGSSSHQSNFPNRQVLIMKLSSAGETTWTRLYGATNRYNGGFDLFQADDGGYYVATYSQTYQSPEMDFDNWWLLRLNKNGDTIWTRWWGGPKNDDPLAIIPTVDRGVILTGLRDGNSNWFQSIRIGNADIYCIKADSLGIVPIEEQPAKPHPLAYLKPNAPNPFSFATTTICRSQPFLCYLEDLYCFGKGCEDAGVRSTTGRRAQSNFCRQENAPWHLYLPAPSRNFSATDKTGGG